jgi:hypothetical protein
VPISASAQVPGSATTVTAAPLRLTVDPGDGTAALAPSQTSTTISPPVRPAQALITG